MSDWQEILERARAKQQQKKEAQESSEATEETQATTNSNDNIDSQDQSISISDIRLKTFKEYNQKLSKNKSQLPNLTTQSRIFEPVTPGRRKFFKDWRNIPVVGRDDVIVEHKFHQLNELDRTGWLVMLRFVGSDFISAFTRYEFLKALRKEDTGKDYKWLRSFLDRIGETRFSITLNNKEGKWVRYTGSLAPQDVEREDGKFAVQLSQPLATMFGFDGWSFIDLDQRLKLGQNQFAQAFHAYLSTNQCPKRGLWWKKSELWKQWGSNYKNLRDFQDKFKSRVLKPLYDIGFITKVQEKKTAIGIWWQN